MTKRFLLGIFIVCFVFFLGIGVGSFLSSQKQVLTVTSQLSETTQEATVSGVATETKTETLQVKRVIDGDTIELTDGRRVRYIGIDTPETVDPRKSVQCFGKEASEKNKELVLNKEIEIEKDISETDQYGRLLRYVYIELPDRGKIMVNEFLVKEGYATSSTFPPDVKYQDVLVKAEQDARNLHKGLWGSCTENASGSPSTIETNGFPPVSGQLTTQASPQTSGCVIKGNISSGGKIYHLPGCGSYDKTSIDESAGEHWFCTENEAITAGWRKAKNC